MEFDAIIFDCDGVLVDSEILGLNEVCGFLRAEGFSWTPADLIRLFTGYRDDVFKEKLSAEYENIHGRAPGPDLFEGLINVRRARRHELKAVPGAEKTLQVIAHPKAVASSSRAEFLHAKLKRTRLHEMFAPHVYSAELVAHGKPAPDIFIYAAEQLQTAPSRCLVIEDSVNGVKSGLAAGMTVWGFLGGGHCFDGHGDRLIDAGAHDVVDNFAALSARLTPPQMR